MKDFPKLSEQQEKEVCEKLHQWCLGNGLVMYPPNYREYNVECAPVTLYPTPIPRRLFEKAHNVQTLFNKLYAGVVTNYKDWLVERIRELSGFDKDYTGKLYEIYEKSLQADGKSKQPFSLGLFRSDYMLSGDGEKDHSALEIKQIEFNTVSISFGGLSTRAGQLHDYLNNSGTYDANYSYRYYDDEEIPISDSLSGLARGLAWGNYYYHHEKDIRKTVVLFIVQKNERNCFDQRLIEYELLKNYGLRSYRLTLQEVLQCTTVNQDKLYLKHSMDEVSVVYFRAGYSPNDYEVEPNLTWEARLRLENSFAVKCPSILMQLAGSKKIQQLLNGNEIIEHVCPDLNTEEVNDLVSTFVAMYPLDSSQKGQLGKKLVFENPDNFVLKPQREGGGNNVYGEDILNVLRSLDEKDWGLYILMEMIRAPTYQNKIIRLGTLYDEAIISELGIFGIVLYNENSGEIQVNDHASWLLRSKFGSSNEGGVAAGFGCIDSVYLY